MNGRITAVAVMSLAALGVVGRNHLVARTTEKAVSIWAVSDGEKIERDDVNSPLKRANSLWNGQVVKLFGARNEIIAFQVMVEAGDRGVGALSSSLRELVHKNRGAKITYAPPALDPTNYVGRPIQIFSVNYMNVTRPTGASWIYRPGSPSAPKDPLGWKPVQLAPENAKRGKGGFPLKVTAGNKKAVLIEKYKAGRLPPRVDTATSTRNTT